MNESEKQEAIAKLKMSFTKKNFVMSICDCCKEETATRTLVSVVMDTKPYHIGENCYEELEG